VSRLTCLRRGRVFIHPKSANPIWSGILTRLFCLSCLLAEIGNRLRVSSVVLVQNPSPPSRRRGVASSLVLFWRHNQFSYKRRYSQWERSFLPTLWHGGRILVPEISNPGKPLLLPLAALNLSIYRDVSIMRSEPEETRFFLCVVWHYHICGQFRGSTDEMMVQGYASRKGRASGGRSGTSLRRSFLQVLQCFKKILSEIRDQGAT
jgi:hypothetical protein